MSDEPDPSFVDRLSRQGEDALGRIAEELIANPVVNRAVTGALEAREKAVQAQEAAMGALNIPSAADVERLTRRLRSVSQRLEGIEDALDRMEERLGGLGGAATAASRRRPTTGSRRSHGTWPRCGRSWRPAPSRAARSGAPHGLRSRGLAGPLSASAAQAVSPSSPRRPPPLRCPSSVARLPSGGRSRPAGRRPGHRGGRPRRAAWRPPSRPPGRPALDPIALHAGAALVEHIGGYRHHRMGS